jgi:hypothetical protein
VEAHAWALCLDSDMTWRGIADPPAA